MDEEYIVIKKDDLENIKKNLHSAENDYLKYRDRYFKLREYFKEKGFDEIFEQIEVEK
jgi:hypothetical protein